MNRLLILALLLPRIVIAAPSYVGTTNEPFTDRQKGATCPFEATQPEKCFHFSDANALKQYSDELRGHTSGWVNVGGTYGTGGIELSTAAASAISKGFGIIIAHPITIATAVGDICSSPLHVMFEGGGKLLLNTGGSVTLGPKCAFSAPLSQAFQLGTASDFSGLTFQARVAEVVPQWWGADATGVADSYSAIAAASAAAALVGAPLSFPGGLYSVSAPLIPPPGSLWRGSGRPQWNGSAWGPQTIIQARSGFSGAGVINLSRSASGTGVSIENMQVDVAARSGIHGLYSDGTVNGGPAQIEIRNVMVINAGGSGVRMLGLWQATLDGVTVDNSVDHNFYFGTTGTVPAGTGALLTTTLRNCYAKRTADGKAGLRVLYGNVTVIGSGFIDPPSNNTTFSDGAVFGQSATAGGGDAVESPAHVTLIENDFEDFTRYGVWCKYGTSFTLIGGSFVAPAATLGGGATPAVVALRTDLDTGKGSVISGSTRVSTKGASWANGYAMHTNILPLGVIQFGGGVGFDNAWVDSGGYTQIVPTIITDAAQGTSLRIRAAGLILASSFSNGAPWTVGSSAPGSGTHAVGEIVWNTTPAAGGPPGWVCTTAGSPGTWKAMANLAP